METVGQRIKQCMKASAPGSWKTTLWMGKITIIATMVLCSHSMVLETAVLKKTGASTARMVAVRTLAAIALGLLLNALLPGTPAQALDAAARKWMLPLGATLWQWFLSTLKLLALMTAIIFALNILQRVLIESGIMDAVASIFKPLMSVFGLPSNVTFLWLVANIVGLSYGAAVMLDEISHGRLSERDVKLLDSHICVSHSNVEDLSLMAALGGVWWVMLTIRLAAAVVLVWEHRLEFYIKDKYYA